MKKTLPCCFAALLSVFFFNASFSQAPVLGTTSSFVLFTTVGAVGNTGISQLTGNVGTNSGSNTGFGNVNGVMHSTDATTLATTADLGTLYNQINRRSTSNLGQTLGNQTLSANVYAMTGVTTLSSTLILDGGGNANGIFIFKIPGAFVTTAGAKVKLINGALACNVFWKVEGSVTLAAQTLMRGTIVANNGAISTGVQDTLEGRLLSIGGAISVNNLFAYTPTGCGSPVLTGPAAPVLGTAACFAIFSGNGTVTNSGTTNVTGDVGTNVGLTTGFSALLVNGTIHPAPDGATAQSDVDLKVAYNYLNLLPADIELLYPAQFGNNLVLTPHTYLMNSAATFTDSLYLNAEGLSTAIFVIKIKGALNATANSKVFLINGAQARNVYWVVDGATGIHDNSVFNGTLIVNNAAIDISTGTTLNGRALTTNGALSTAGSTVISPTGNCLTLPVTWLYFRGTQVQKNVLLEWATSNEMNNGYFTIEKSNDGQVFQPLTTVGATKTTSTAERTYSFTDQQPGSINFYRISQTDKDGKVNPYNTISVKTNITEGFEARNYVQGGSIYLMTSGATVGKGSVELFSMEGKKMLSQNVILTKEPNVYKITRPLHRGMYLLYLQSNGKKLYTGKVMVL